MSTGGSIFASPRERHVWLTVNEYETMLMRKDLPEVLRDPLRYMLRHSKALLCHPAAIPAKMRTMPSMTSSICTMR